jgi:predicted AAA+ superfamily ATPase
VEVEMIKRKMKSTLIELAKFFPIVTITGPRQSGKTTLVKAVFPEYQYITLEDPDTQQFAKTDPRRFLSQFKKSVILDEVQHVPELFSYIQTIVDKENKSGMFILTGSNQFSYMNSISQSLAGRTGILKLLPFSYHELYQNRVIPLEQILYSGFYPRIFDKNIPPEYFLSSYLETYIQKDVRNITNIKYMNEFFKFIQLCAGRTGQIVNYNSIGNALGIDHKTVKKWISILEASYIITLIQPHFKNYNKRIIKSPKLYFIDVGLVCYLLRIQTLHQLEMHPLRGEIFETYVVGEFLKNRFNKGKTNNLYYFRDSNGNEVDLIFENGIDIVPIEIKSAMTVNSTFFKGLNYFRKINPLVKNSVLIMGTDIKQIRSKHWIYGYSNVDELISELNCREG